jgi:hypothetical protein
MTSEMRTYSTAPSVMEGKGHRENGLRILGTANYAGVLRFSVTCTQDRLPASSSCRVR